MNIRPMLPQELPQTAALIATLVPWELPLAYVAERYGKIRNHPDYTVLVAEENGVILGTVTVITCHALAGDFLTLEDVVVHPEQRGKGIGRKLMEAVDALAAEQNCEYTILVSSGFRKEAHAFYEAVGYTDNAKGFRKWYAAQQQPGN